MRFITYNILEGGKGRESQILEILAAQNADAILLQEVTEREFVEQLAAGLQADYYIAESNSSRHLALLTRSGLREASSFHPPIMRHGMLEATLEAARGVPVTLIGIHLAAPAYTMAVELYRLRELNLILKHTAASVSSKTILAGDFNSIAPGDAVDLSGLPWHIRASVILQGGLFARQVIGRVHANAFVDCYRTLHPNEDGFTLPTDPPRVRLDYFFVNEGLRLALRACEVIANPMTAHISDHLPLRLELEI